MKSIIKKVIIYLINYLNNVVINSDRVVLFKLAKASASRNHRIEDNNPKTWEFSGFSQNGEDGIIQQLLTYVKNPNKYFVEIGASNGLENNTSFLAIAKGYTGLMIEGNQLAHESCKNIMSQYAIGVKCLNIFVDKESVFDLKKEMLFINPDVFSIDIDGNDYYLADTILTSGIRPKIFIVEYNSAFGPEKQITIKYDKNYQLSKSDEYLLYYGVSLNGWKELFNRNNYHFVCVDSNGVNAFFIDKNEFESNQYNSFNGLNFVENFWQKTKFNNNWQYQFDLISEREFVKI